MKVTHIETLRCDAGWRMFSFLKVMTDEGIVGWSEYNESFGSHGLSGVIEALSPVVIGRDPRDIELINCHLRTQTVQSRGGINRQAVAAIENALLDIKARSLGVPVYSLLGGPLRDRIRLYWSHCATYRVSRAKEMGIPPVRTLDDIVAMGREVVAKGYTALKTNALLLGDNPRAHVPGFGRSAGFPELNADRHVLDAIRAELAAFREGAGPGMDILVDLNFNYKTEGFLKMARAMEPYDLFWVEMDTRDAKALAYVRSRTTIPVASCECLFGRRDYRPFFERQAVDVAIIDTPWNGVAESLKIAAMADAYEINVAPTTSTATSPP